MILPDHSFVTLPSLPPLHFPFRPPLLFSPHPAHVRHTLTHTLSLPSSLSSDRYQSSDGTWVFLHPLNLRCLLHHYGTYEACPTTLNTTILELEDVVQVRGGWRVGVEGSGSREQWEERSVVGNGESLNED